MRQKNSDRSQAYTGGDIEPADVPVNTGNHNPYIPERPGSSGGF